MSALHVCHGVTPKMTCRFNGACYGEICIAPSICGKAEVDLTDEDRATIARVNGDGAEPDVDDPEALRGDHLRQLRKDDR